MTGSPEPAAADTPVPAVWMVAGGKGGVGRSLLVANMAIQLARLGRRVVAVDLDFQGASLHTYLGLSRPARSLEAVSSNGNSSLAELLLDTSVANLKLLAGVASPPPADKAAALRERFLREAPGLPGEVVLADCGSGRGDELLDLFRAGAGGIFVTTPEPAAVESLYLFTEAMLGRVLLPRLDAGEREKLEIARLLDENTTDGISSFRAGVERLRHGGEEALAEKILEALRPLRLRLVLNQVRGDSDTAIAAVLHSGFEKYFGLNLRVLGCVEYDLSVLQSVQKRKSLSQQYPNSPATLGMERSISSLLHEKRGGVQEDLPLEKDLAAVDHYRQLEVPAGAPSRDVQAAYQNLKRGYEADFAFRHPQLSLAQLERIGSLMESAYRTLVFLESRTEYDRRLVAEGVLRPEQASAPEPESPPPAAAPADTVHSVPVTAKDSEEAPASSPASAPQAGPPPVPGRGIPVTGATLRGHREAAKLAVEAVVERIKIRPAILAALEEDRYADLPEPVFLKGFLRQLALCLGLDPGVVCREYLERMAPPPPPHPPARKP